jgi:fatty-acyl-CoA synthase
MTALRDFSRRLLGAGPEGVLELVQNKLGYGKTMAQFLYNSGVVGQTRPAGVLAMARAALAGVRDPNIFLHVNALNHPDRPAVVFQGRRLTFGELDRRIGLLTQVLEDAGVRSGERVALMMHNSTEFIETSAAATRLGGTVVPVGYRLKAAEVGYILANSGARALVFDAELADVVEGALRHRDPALSPPAVLPGALLAVRRDGDRLPAFARDYEAALLGTRGRAVGLPRGNAGVMVYTSGTTGRPKGALRNMGTTGFEPIVSLMLQIGMNKDDRHLSVCPLYHALAGFFCSFNLIMGATVVIVPKFEAEEALRLMHEEQITTCAIVPTMIRRLVELPPEVLARYRPTALRALVSSAAPLPAELARATLDRLGPVLWNTYGASEFGLCTLASPDDLAQHPGTIGRLLPGNQIRFFDDDGGEVPEGEVGELFVGNTTTIDEYHGNAEATQKARRQGLFSVGDMGRRSASGHYFLVDRKSDMVISGGVNIYPAEIEQTLHEHPGIAETAVIGIPDADWGEALAAFVVPARADAPPAAEELVAFCKERLAGYKVPRQVHYVTELPRNPSGKVLKRELRDRLAARSSA